MSHHSLRVLYATGLEARGFHLLKHTARYAVYWDRLGRDWYFLGANGACRHSVNGTRKASWPASDKFKAELASAGRAAIEDHKIAAAIQRIMA